MARWLILLLLLSIVALTSDQHRVTFLQPKRTFILSGPYGVDVPVQTYIPPDSRNRVWALAWDGEGCAGSSQHSLNGDEEAAIQPETPLSVRMAPGTCYLRVAVLGAGQALLGAADLAVHVCGGQEDCGTR